MINFYKIIEDKIINVFNKLGYPTDGIVVFESSRKDLGEYQFNGAMNLAKVLHKSPMEIANTIIDELNSDEFFQEISIANPGFINMRISSNGLIDYINNLKLEYEKKNKLIFLDYGGANVAKSLHVGHLRSANIGEGLKRLCEFLGYNTISDTHLGDFGRPLGLVILELSKRHPDWVYFDSTFEGEFPCVEITNQDLEEIYPYASAKAKEDEAYLKEAQVMTKRLQNHERGIYDLWKEILKVSVKSIKETYDRLNATFDLFMGESDAENIIPEMMEYLNKLDIIEESEGAKVITVSKEEDKLEVPPMLLLKSDGGYLYSTTELATIYERMKLYNPDELWYLTDKRQDLHFNQVFRAAYKSNIVKPETKLYFLGFGTMNGKDGKPFKTRDGGVLKLDDLIEMVYEEAIKRLNSNVVEDRENIAEKITMATIKFADLLSNRESDYIFDIEKFSDTEGKTGPFILYSTIRMKSLLKKAKEAGIKYNKLLKVSNEFDRDVILTINNLDLILNKAFNTRSLNDITDYLFKLTSSYNRFYTENFILNEEDKEKQESWLYLTELVYNINKTLLDILAIKIPEKM